MDNAILSPKSDYIFKLIFGDNRNIDILSDFLQSILDLPEDEYSHISIVDPNLRQETEDDKLGILDIKIHTKSDKVINVEIQVSDFPQMRERIVFYSSKMITEQIGKGESYEVIKKVISIVITDYVLIPENEIYHNKYHLYDKDTGSQFTDIVEINTLELPKLPNETDNTNLWHWLRFLKSGRKEELSMIAEHNPQIKKAVGVLMELSQDERTRLIYEQREKARRDNQARLDGAYAKGMNRGIEKGVKDVAKRLLAKKMPQTEVADATGLTLDEVKAISKES